MEGTKELITTDAIRSKVYILRGQQVMVPTKPIDFFGSCGYAPIIRKTGTVQIPRIKIFYGSSLAHFPKRRGILWSI